MSDWQMMLGDCREKMLRLPDESVDMVWTDPPYGHGNADGDFASRRHKAMKDGRRTAQTAIANDDEDGMRTVVDGMLLQAVRVLKKDSCCCCCCCGGGGPRPTFAWVANRMDAQGLSFFHSIIWDKKNPGVGWRYRRQHEMVMVAHRKGGGLAWADPDVAQPNIMRISKPRGGLHPNEKPVELMRKFIALHTKPGDTVLDPFCGAGSTGVAALELGRRFIGIELDPKFYQVSCDRLTDVCPLYTMRAAA